MPRSSFCLLQQIFKLVHALLQPVLLAYPALELEGSKLGVGYLVSDGGVLAPYYSLQNGSVEVPELSFYFPYLRVGATLGGALGGFSCSLLAILCKGRIVTVTEALR
jgi:hypothetical protein